MKSSGFYTLLLSLLPGVGPSRYWSWIDLHQTPEKALLAPLEQLPSLNALAQKMLRDFQALDDAGQIHLLVPFQFWSFDDDSHYYEPNLLPKIMIKAVRKMFARAISKKKIHPSFMSWS